MLVFGPDKLPDFARQAGRMVRQLRDFANEAQDELREELGPEYADLELRDLDPRRPSSQAHRRGDERGADDPIAAAANPLADGEAPPWDVDAT